MTAAPVLIAPRDDGHESRPADELTRYWAAEDDFLIQRFPIFVKAVTRYPDGQSQHTWNEFYWFKEQFEKRPAFTLEHSTWYTGDDFLLVSGRQFFVSHTYNCQQTVSLVLPLEDGDGTVLFFVNSTPSDLVVRYVRRVALPIGQKIMRRELNVETGVPA